MVRWTGALLAALVIALFIYLPSVYSAGHFARVHQTEAARIAEAFGDEFAASVGALHATLSARSRTAVVPPAHATDVEQSHQGGAAVRGGGEVAARLVNNAYARAVEAMFELFLFRAASLLQYLLVVFPVLLLALFDGLTDREVRSREFGFHSPAVYGVFLGSAILLAVSVLPLFCWAGPLHPLLVAGLPVVCAFLGGRALAHFHRTAA